MSKVSRPLNASSFTVSLLSLFGPRLLSKGVLVVVGGLWLLRHSTSHNFLDLRERLLVLDVDLLPQEALHIPW